MRKRCFSAILITMFLGIISEASRVAAFDNIILFSQGSEAEGAQLVLLPIESDRPEMQTENRDTETESEPPQNLQFVSVSTRDGRIFGGVPLPTALLSGNSLAFVLQDSAATAPKGPAKKDTGASLQTLPYTISGTVYGGGNPLADTTITLYPSGSGTPIDSAVSDASGHYAFEVESGTYDLLVSPPASSGLSDSLVNGVVVSDANVTQNIVLLQEACVISGTVRRPDGSPVANALVYLTFPETSWVKLITDVTDENGHYAFFMAPGIYKLSLNQNYINQGYGGNPVDASLPQSWLINPFTENLQVNGNLTKDIVLPLVTVSGRVVDSEGNGVGGVELRSEMVGEMDAYCVNYDGQIISDTDGSFTMPLMAGIHQITLLPSAHIGFAPTVYEDLTFTEDSQRDFVLADGFDLGGVVRKLDGSPAVNVRLAIREHGAPNPVAVITTDENGAYSINLVEGIYDILFTQTRQHSDPTMPSDWWIDPLVQNLPITQNTTLDIDLPITMLSGRVLDYEGTPVSNVEVSVDVYWRENNAYYNITSSSTSDAEGNYAIPLYVHDYEIILTPPNGSEYGVTILHGVSVPGATVHDLILPQPFLLSGVVRQSNGSGVNQAMLYLNDQVSGLRLARIYADAHGAYSCTLSPGVYSLEVHQSNGGADPAMPFFYMIWPYSRDVSITEDTAFDIEIPIARISGQTTDGNGVPVEGVELQSDSYLYRATDDPQDPDRFSYSNQNGHIISNAAGDYVMPMMVIDQMTHQETIIPPAGSGFAQTVIGSLTVAEDSLQNVILSWKDEQAPVILSGPCVNNITGTSAVIEWRTNEPATGTLLYGTTEPPATSASVEGFRTSHAVPLDSLSPDTVYFVQVASSDASGNGPTTSDVIRFCTSAVGDDQPPVILEGPIAIPVDCSGEAVIAWLTNEPADSVVLYGLDKDLGNTVSNDDLVLSHRVTLTGLEPSTVYYVKVQSTDALGNGPTESHRIAFTTGIGADSQAPIIVEGPMVINVTDTGATIEWTTDEPATSGVSYNDGTSYGLVKDSQPTARHSVRLADLTPSTLYYLTVSSTDACGNGPTLSETFDFTTSPEPDNTPPVIIEGPLLVNVTHQSAVIRWVTDEPADSVIEYGLSQDLGTTTTRTAQVRHHNMTLVGLEPGTHYFYKVRSTDTAGNTGTSQIGVFTTHILPDHVKPRFTKGPWLIHKTNKKAMVYWQTDEPADTVIEYGAQGQQRFRHSDGEKVTEHQVTLTGLEPGQNYAFTAMSTDLAGNCAISEPAPKVSESMSRAVPKLLLELPETNMFTTELEADTTAPTITEGPDVVSISDTMAIVHWATDEIADTRVKYGENPAAILSKFAGDILQVTKHAVVLTNLTPSTSYSFRISSIDPSANVVESAVLEFTTLATSDTNGPTIMSVATIGDITFDQATVGWLTDEPATSRVLFGTDAEALDREALVVGLARDRTVSLTNLMPVSTYFYRVSSSDASGNVTLSEAFSFTTTETPPSGKIAVNPDSLSFLRGSGYEVDVLLSGAPTRQPLTITNDGDADLSIQGVTINGAASADYQLANLPAFPHRLATGESLEVEVVFDPAESTPAFGLSASVVIASDDDDEPEMIVSLQGDAVPVEVSLFEIE